MSKVQGQVDEVVDIMRNNVNKVMDRGEQLDSLQSRTEDLQNASAQFRTDAGRVRKQMWWKDMKIKIIIGSVIAIIIIGVVVGLTTKK
jgi:vesicle-associated membrane protein 4